MALVLHPTSWQGQAGLYLCTMFARMGATPKALPCDGRKLSPRFLGHVEHIIVKWYRWNIKYLVVIIKVSISSYMHIQNISNWKIRIRLAIMLYSLKMFHRKSVFHKTVFFSLHKTVFKCLPLQHQYFIKLKMFFESSATFTSV